MLVLSRKHQESVVVGNVDGSECLLKVTVIEIRGNRVKLGFEAADDIPIHRTELWEPRPADTQPKSRNAAAKESMEQWDDDGGAVSSLHLHRKPRNVFGSGQAVPLIVDDR